MKTKAVFDDTQQLYEDDNDYNPEDMTADQRQTEYSKTKSISDDCIDEKSTALQHRNRTETDSKNEPENQKMDGDDNQNERRVNNGHDTTEDVTDFKQIKKRPCETTPTSTSTATISRTHMGDQQERRAQ